MSHFTVMIIGSNPEEQLAPFNENLEVDRYCEYTKEQLIKNERDSIDKYKNGTYAEYLKDPIEYAKNTHEGHLKYLSEEFPLKLSWTDEQCYQEAIRYHEPEDIGKDGEVYSERNPKSKWDWYSLGGRWSGMIKLKEGAIGIHGRSGVFGNEVGIDQAYKADIENISELQTFALIKDGQWYERGEMGWFGISHNEISEEKWSEEFNKLISDLPDHTLISIYDCHI